MEEELDPERATTRLELRPRFCDTDLMGIVHHANHLAYFEMGRVEWLRRRGVTYAEWARRGMHLPVVEVGVRYVRPIAFDDAVVVETTLAELRSHSMRFEYRILRGDEVLAKGFTRLACVDASHALQRVPGDVAVVLRSPEVAASR